MSPLFGRAALGCLLALCSFFGFTEIASAAYGRTAGSFSVSNSGAAQYTIPIWNPPGINGLQPNLALNYSSTKSDGLLGVGFSIPGQSSIGHCNATIAQDGYAGGLGFGSLSILCLDGNRLRLQSGVAGQSGSVYRTEIETYSRITAYGTAGNAAAYFIVEAKDGLYYEYGNTADSRIEVRNGTDVRNWALNRVRDRAGNYMDYVYTEDTATGSYRISEIKYTGNVGQGTSPSYSVKFVYESASRPDPLYAFYPSGNGSNEINEFKRLDKVEIYRGTTLLRFYDVSWDAAGGAGGQSRISSVQECASAGNCLLPISFTWRSGTAGFGAQNTVSGLGSAWPMDINGDGRDDLVYSASNVWRYRLGNTAGGFDSEVSSGVSSVGYVANQTIEWDGDGRDDLLLTSGGTWRVLRSNGSGFDSPINTGISADTNNTGFYDINADGRHDLLRTQNVSGQLRIYSRLRLASGFATSETLVYDATNEWVSITAAGVPWIHPTWRTRTNVKRWDYDGDRREDFALYLCYDDPEPWAYDYCAWVAFFGTGTPTAPSVQMGDQITADGLTWAPMPADFNGDGTTDLVYAYGGAWRSRGGGSSLHPEVMCAPTAGHTGFPVITDYDSDGKSDVVVRSTSSGAWEIVRGIGLSLSQSTITGPSAANGISPFIGDFNGDGLTDLAWTNSSTNTLTYAPRAGVFPDLLQSATDGFGVSVNFNYASLAAYSGYTRTTGAVYPTQEFTGTAQVVSSVEASNGIGNTYLLNNFLYEGARLDHYGRGPLGFSARSWTDSRNGLSQKLQFDQLFPLAGMTKQAETWNGATLVARSVSTNASVALDSTPSNQRYFVYSSGATATQYEVGGPYNGALLRTVTTANSYDNASGALYDQTVTSTEPASGANGATAGGIWTARTYAPLANITNDTTTWCLGRPGQVQQIRSHNLTYGSAITRTENTVWNTTFCRPTQAVSEPGNGTLQVTTDIGYDNFGNVNSTTVTGVGMAARNTTVVYTGQFPTSVKNALDQYSTSVWNYDLGVPASTTNPNGISVSWQYDEFGRRTRETRPDSTFSTWAYVQCATCDPRVRMYVVQTEYGSAGSATGALSIRVLDQFDRQINEYAYGLTGALNATGRNFDAQGRVVNEYFPYLYSSGPGAMSTISYDLVGRPVQVVRPISDSNSSLQYSYAYFEGLTTRSVDALGKQSTKISNALGELVRSVDHDGYYQYFDYDAFGSVRRVSDSVGYELQSSNYNVRGMLTARTSMNMGTWSFTPNALGETVSQTDGKNQSTSFVFDKLGRLTSRSENEGTSIWTWGTSSSAKNIGQLASVSGPGYSESYAYDSIGRPSATMISADTTYQINFTYNSLGALDTLMYPASTSSFPLTLHYAYQYGNLFRIEECATANCSSFGPALWTANTVNSRDQITQETFGNGLVTNRTIDAVTGWQKSIQTGVGGGTGVQNLGYEWDLVGNLKKRKDLNQSSLTEEFFYDNLHRLDYSTLNTGVNLDMTYNALGNITYKSDVGTYTYSGHQVTSTSNGWSFTYDGNGNMTSGRGRNISWTSFNYPLCIRSGAACAGTDSDYSQFSYTPDRRYWKQESNYTNGGAATTIYVAGLLEKVSTSSGTDYRHMIRAGGSTVIASRKTSDPNNTSYTYVTSDHLGSSSAVTNSSGVILVNSSFDAFGKRRGSNWSGSPSTNDWSQIAATTRRGYTDHSMLDNLGLLHMGGRVQDPVLGRFISADPYISYPGMTQSYNRYSYVQNNPLSRFDPSGFQDTDSTFTTVNEDRDVDPFSSMMAMIGSIMSTFSDPTATHFTTGLEDAMRHLGGFRGARGDLQLQSVLAEFGDFGLGYWMPGSKTTMTTVRETSDGKYEDVPGTSVSGESNRRWVWGPSSAYLSPAGWAELAWRLKSLYGMYGNATRQPGFVERAADALGVDQSFVQTGLAAADFWGAGKAAQYFSQIANTGYQLRYVALGNGIVEGVGGVGVATGYSLTGTAQFGMFGLAFLGGYAFGSGIDHALQAADICLGCMAYEAIHNDDGTYKSINLTDGGVDWTRKH